VKLVVEERESDALRELLRQDADQLASALVEVEVVRAVRRAVPELVPQAEQVVAQIAIVEVNELIRTRAQRLEPVTLRSLDALHLATALEVGEELDAVVSYDARMADAAKALGLRVVSPA
jgi:predicted nucleic acid-binding protein